MSDETLDRIRVDKWLWHARFFKSRASAGQAASSGRLRINGQRCEKPAQPVRPGDVLTFPQERRVRIVRVEAVGTRRGPAAEAQGLYTDLEPPAAPAPGPAGPRPTGRDRRRIDGLRQDGS